MVRVIMTVITAVGELVYYTLYVPTWVAWQLVGKPLFRIVDEIRGQDRISDELLDVARYGNIGTLREMLVRMYYNRVMEEEACARFA